MNPMGHMKDPAAGMPPQLLAHMHLISKHRYPVIANPSLETIVSMLMEAPKLVRDLQPVQWQFLDAPADGSILLTWQPLDYLGTNFASDGYVWADPEQTYTSEVRGYRLEIVMHRAGYKATGEPVACHSRKRYRLLPGNPAHGLPTPDPALWIIHYTRANSRDQVPAASVPIPPHVHAALQQRRMIQTQGQLARKEFMLHDRANWPVINLPQAMSGRPGSGPMVPGAGHRRGGSMGGPLGEISVEEEEDVSRGDALDLITPREISRVRYEQHHEWMEELLESAYSINQIVPSDLGLGRKGELESLTRGFFDAPMSATHAPTNGAPPRVGKLDPGKAAEFTKLAAEKVATMQKELEEMKAKHVRRMEKLKQTSVLAAAEKKLRTATHGAEGGDGVTKQGPGASTDDIVQEVESAWGRKIERVQNIKVVQRGGLEDPAPRPHPSISARTMSSTSTTRPFATANLTQGTPGPEARQSPTIPQPQQAFSQPQQPTPIVQLQSTPSTTRVAEPIATIAMDQKATPEIAAESAAPSTSTSEPAAPASQGGSEAIADGEEGSLDLGDDINMDGLEEQEDANAEVENQDWVMVDDEASKISEGVSIPANSHTGIAQSSSEQVSAGDTPGQSIPPESAAPVPDKPTAIDQQAPDGFDSSMPDPELDSADLGLEDEFDNVGDMDTAGDALAQYGEADDDLDLDNMVDDSAFGDAFHPPDD